MNASICCLSAALVWIDTIILYFTCSTCPSCIYGCSHTLTLNEEIVQMSVGNYNLPRGTNNATFIQKIYIGIPI